MIKGPRIELRTDPITGRQVIFSTARADRPGGLVLNTSWNNGIENESDCPFCRGNEHLTPPASAQYPLTEGSSLWEVRSFENKYPVVLPGIMLHGAENGDGQMEGVTGQHEVIVETPFCTETDFSLSENQQYLVLRMYHDRLNFFRRMGKVKSYYLFKNHGKNAGATMRHEHSQLLLLDFIPVSLSLTAQKMLNHKKQTGSYLLSDLLEREIALGQRVVSHGKKFACLAPFAATQPFEVHFYPYLPKAHFADTEEDERKELAGMMCSVMQKLQEQVGKFAYNVNVVTAPDYSTELADGFTWYLKLIPRLTGLAGFELESDCRVNPVLPETYAEMLRG